MARQQKYTIRNLRAQFPSDDVCLDFIYDALHSRKCSCGGEYKPLFRWDNVAKKLEGRKQYQCSKCRYQIAPLAGTIFHKSATPLTDWFYTLFIFSNAKSGVSAKEIERQLGVTYKTAWRMLKQIRAALGQDNDKLTGDVEMDGAMFGGRRYTGKWGENKKQVLQSKTKAIAAIERGGKAKVKVVSDLGAKTHKDFLEENVSTYARLLTDHAKIYRKIDAPYQREHVVHRKGEYARGDVHINNVEVFWGHVKRSIKGTHKVVSSGYLQSYLDAFAFHYNNRHSDSERFAVLLGAVLRGAV